MEGMMLVRMRVVLPVVLVLALFTSLGIAKDKKKSAVPDYVLKARTVYVLIDPDAGTSLTAPMANKTAQDDVEKALMKWGRLSPVIDMGSADLVITVRKGSGKIVDRTIGGQPTNDRPVVVQQTDNAIRVGVQQGRPPDATGPAPQDTRPQQQTEVGSSQDMFVVYQGHVGNPAENAPIAWRFSSKDALRSDDVPAVAAFRKAIEDAEKKQQKGKQP
jgi:hypothetical protein